MSLADVFGQIEEAFKANNLHRVEALLWPAVEQFPDIAQFWFYGGCVYFKTGRPAVAAQLFRKAIDLEDSPHIYSNLGACLRRMNRHEEGLTVLRAALDRDPDYAPALVNYGSMFVNEGMPQGGIPALEKAVRIGTERGATWNLGLLYLEAARFGEGFDCYRQGLAAERLVRTFSREPEREPVLLPVGVTAGEGEYRDKSLLVWGEQGIGDELMFGTVLEEARRDFGEVILEGHPRLTALHEGAHPGLEIHATRKDSIPDWYDAEGRHVDFKCGIGDLAAIYRRSPQRFVEARQRAGAPYSPVDTRAETARYRENLQAIAGPRRPVVGLATRGGVMQTARTYRTLGVEDVGKLFADTEALFVALDYDDMTGFAAHVGEKFGPDRYRWFPGIVQHYDYVHTAALARACDLVVTVCQTVAHLCAGLGVPVRVLTPQRCAWRYALVPELGPECWYWYPDERVRLYRQDDPQSWSGPVARAVADIRQIEVAP